MNDFKKIYEGESLNDLPLTYIDYAVWQRQSGESLLKERAYWSDRLSGSLPRVELPALKERAEAVIYHGDIESFSIPGSILTDLKKRASEWEVSEYMFLISVYYLLLAKISGQTDIIIGTDTIGRTQAELQNVVGTFVNVLPLRVEVLPGMPYSEMLSKVKETVLDGFDNQELPYDEMLKLAGKGQNESIVDVYFSNADFFKSEAETSDLSFKPITLDKKIKTTRWELEINVEEINDTLKLSFHYSTDLYDKETIHLFISYYRNILETIIYSPELTVDQIELEGSLQSI
jgi:non-ribosomal peptide synthetase component F